MNLESSEDLLGRNESDQIKSKLREFNGTFWKGSFPVFGFIFLYCWVYYTYVVIFLFDIMTNRKFFIYFCGGAFHVLFLLEISSFLRTVFNDAGRLPNSYKLPEEMVSSRTRRQRALSLKNNRQTLLSPDSSLVIADLPLSLRLHGSESGRPTHLTICKSCYQAKPPRTHHCRYCSRCVMKFDHHCHWLDNCIAAANYKFFLLFIIYLELLSTFVTFSTVPYLSKAMTSSDELFVVPYQLIALTFLAAIIMLALSCFVIFHLHLVSINMTTVESIANSHKHPYDMGLLNNVSQVFGSQMWTWPFPILKSVTQSATIFETRTTLPQTISQKRKNLSRPHNTV